MAAVAAVTGSGTTEETAVLAGQITGATSAINQFTPASTYASYHVIMDGAADKGVARSRIFVEGVNLDPQGRIIANAYPEVT